MYVFDTILGNIDNNNREGNAASVGLFLILTLVVVSCIAFLKNPFRRRAKNSQSIEIECTKITVLSEATAVENKLKSQTPDMSRFLTSNEFRAHYNALKADTFNKMVEEFDTLKIRGEMAPTSQGQRPFNSAKNRFVNVIAFDHSRFKLRPIEGVVGSDYVNANYVSGFYSPIEYLATQGPLKNTVNDFWRMCWESGTKCIVMLTPVDKGEKCFRYWPNCSGVEKYGDVEVEILSEVVEAFNFRQNWIVSDMILRCGGEERKVRHYLYLTWEDFESIEPPEALVCFIRQVRKFAPYPTGTSCDPIVIHCSAGVGRTGTFIAVDIALNQLVTNNGVDIPEIVGKMRKERVFMVQTEQQYACIYKCVIAVLDEMESKRPIRMMTKSELVFA